MYKVLRNLDSREGRGFTLIELLVVVAIIGILSSVVLASLNSARKKGRDARRVSDLKQFQLALELYADNQAPYGYPATQSGNALPTLGSQYIAQNPVDPVNTSPYVYQYRGLTSAGANCSTAPCAGYGLRAVLEAGPNSSSITDDIGGSGGLSCDDQASPDWDFCIRN